MGRDLDDADRKMLDISRSLDDIADALETGQYDAALEAADRISEGTNCQMCNRLTAQCRKRVLASRRGAMDKSPAEVSRDLRELAEQFRADVDGGQS